MSRRIKKWAGGFVHPDTGYFYIRRTVGPEEFKVSTKCRTEEGALEELAWFERNPHTYVPGLRAESEQRARFESAVLAYLEYSAKTKGNTPKHVESQARAFQRWSKFLESKRIVHITQFSSALVDDFCAWRRDNAQRKPGAVGPDAVASDVAAIKALFTWAARDGSGLLVDNPLKNTPIPKRPKASSKPKIIDLTWWNKVKPLLDERWQLCGDVLLGSSMRYSSLSRITVDDVDLQNDVVRLPGNAIKGKVGVSLKVTHKVALATRQVAMIGLPESSTDMNHALEKACGKAGVRYASVHSFRHSAAMWMLEDGLSTKQIQQRLAHANVSTTERYLRHLTGDGDYKGRDL